MAKVTYATINWLCWQRGFLGEKYKFLGKSKLESLEVNEIESLLLK